MYIVWQAWHILHHAGMQWNDGGFFNEQELAAPDPLARAEDASKAGTEGSEEEHQQQQQQQNERSLEAKTGAVRLALARNLARAHVASPMAA